MKRNQKNLPGTDEQKRLRNLWLAALRSGLYKQGSKFLRADDKYCCLGVLCDVLKIEPTIAEGYPVVVYDYEDNHYTLPESVRIRVGLRTDCGGFKDENGQADSLSSINDFKNMDFNQIADFIEKNYEKIFQ